MPSRPLFTTVRQLGELYFGFCDKEVSAGNLKQGTVAYYRAYYPRWADHVCTQHKVLDLEISELIQFDLTSWASVWHQYSAVRTVFKWAEDQGLIAHSPFTKVKMPCRGQRNRILGPEEMPALKRAATPAFRDFLLGMEGTMARPGEVRVLQWEDLKETAGFQFFALYEFKARKRRKVKDAVRVIPIGDPLKEVLDRLRLKSLAGGPIFRNQRGQPWTTNAVRCAMRAARWRAGLKPDRFGENVVCYTMRHTAATAAANGGLRDRALADLMGHTDTRMTQRYLHFQVEDLLEKYKMAVRNGRDRKAQ